MLTIPNLLTLMRLGLIPVLLYVLLVSHSYGWAVMILVISGLSDWADGKIARLFTTQSSRIGELLDPLVDRMYVVAVPLGMAVSGIIPWGVVAVLVLRDALLAATLPLLRSRGVIAVPVIYIGKAATFALMSGFPLILLGQWDLWKDTWGSQMAATCGWAMLIWGIGMYVWSAGVYMYAVRLVLQQLPRLSRTSLLSRLSRLLGLG